MPTHIGICTVSARQDEEEGCVLGACICCSRTAAISAPFRSEEHTSELQSQSNLVCRLLLEKKKKNIDDVMIPLQSPPFAVKTHICARIILILSKSCHTIHHIAYSHQLIPTNMTAEI